MTHKTYENILVKKEVQTSCTCDVCGKTIWKSKPRTTEVLVKRNPVYFFHVATGHYGWGNDSVDSIDSFDACSSNCLRDLFDKYIKRKENEHYSLYMHIDGEFAHTEE